MVTGSGAGGVEVPEGKWGHHYPRQREDRDEWHVPLGEPPTSAALPRGVLLPVQSQLRPMLPRLGVGRAQPARALSPGQVD